VIAKLDWEKQYQRELQRAIQVRAMGNEGMARVCCRRAAGIVLGEYLRRRGLMLTTTSVYDRLAIVDNLPDVDERVKRINRHFTIRVNHAHELPPEVDLIQDVAWLKDNLLVS
jgi:hypothetical protein